MIGPRKLVQQKRAILGQGTLHRSSKDNEREKEMIDRGMMERTMELLTGRRKGKDP